MNFWYSWQINYLLLLQQFREITGGVFDNFFLNITHGGETVISSGIIAGIYWCLNTQIATYIYLNLGIGTFFSDLLKNIACILSSDIMSYFAILTFSSIGIERENAKEYELLSIPYVNINDSHYDNLTALYSSYDQESNKSFINESIIGKIKTKINNEEKKIK